MGGLEASLSLLISRVAGTASFVVARESIAAGAGSAAFVNAFADAVVPSTEATKGSDGTRGDGALVSGVVVASIVFAVAGLTAMLSLLPFASIPIFVGGEVGKGVDTFVSMIGYQNQKLIQFREG